MCMLVAPNSPLSAITSFEQGDKAGFMETVRQVAAANVRVPTASPFRFELTAAAAAHNTGILESFDYDLASAIDAFPGTTISPGSELSPPEQLQPLLRHHPTWGEFHDDMLPRSCGSGLRRERSAKPNPRHQRKTTPAHPTPSCGVQKVRPTKSTREGHAPDRVPLPNAHGTSQTSQGQSTPPASELRIERLDPSKLATSPL